MTVLAANTPGPSEPPEVAKWRRMIRPGAQISAVRKAEARRKLAEWEARK